MQNIDKEKFGAFVAHLRKEKGLTQREVADRLHLSDKAVSKWETGQSIPDTGLLLPLAELLGVTVTELLLSRRVGEAAPLGAGETEQAVRAAIAYPREGARAWGEKSRWRPAYLLSLGAAGAGLLLCRRDGVLTESLWTLVLLAALFGGYFVFFARTRLPAYYDQYRVTGYSDGCFRMNLAGLALNNRNWPHILNAARAWAAAVLAVWPFLHWGMASLLPELWGRWELWAVLAAALGGLFLPCYLVGKKWE